jgi:hypothetical protein
MSTDWIAQALPAFGYVTLLVVLTTFWVKSARQPELRRFWTFLALGWTMNLLGNIAWIVHDFVTGTELASFSLVDLFYVARYVWVGLALWLVPASLPRRAWLWIGLAMLAANAIVWPVYYGPLMARLDEPWTSFLGYAMYPVLDAGIVTLAWLRYRAARHTMWDRAALLLFCAMMSYGIANTLNLHGWVFAPVAGGLLPDLFWLLTDIFMLIMALGALKRNIPR